MKKKQLNFYLLPNEFEAFETYLKQIDLRIIGSPIESEKTKFVESLGKTNGFEKFYIVGKEHTSLIKTRFVKQQNHYVVDVTESAIVELDTGFLNKEENTLTRGRLFFTYESSSNTAKPKEFTESSEALLKWFEQNYQTNDYKDYKPIIVSENVQEWILKESGKLIDN